MNESRLRVSCTTLDLFSTYLRHTEPEDWLYSKSKFIEMLTVRSAPSDKMLNGILVHSIIETGEYDEEARDQSNLPLEEFLVDTCVDINNQLKDATFEFKWVKHYPEYNLDLVCKPDALLGNSIYEFKTTERYDYKKYLQSVQWRFYLDVFGADYIHYIVLPLNSSYGNLSLVDEPYQFSFHKSDYDKLEITALIEEFIDFVNQNNLHQYFQPK